MLQELITFLLGGVCFFTGMKLAALINRKRGQRKAQTYLAEHKSQFDLVHVYTGKDEAGKVMKWYSFANPLKLPARRMLAAEAAMKQAEMNIDRDSLLEFISAMEDAGNSGKITVMFAHLKNLEQRINFAAEEETLINLASVYFLIEGEDPLVINDNTQERKRAMIRSSEDAKAFFLTSAFRLTNEYSDMPDSDILSYLSTVRQRIQSHYGKRKRKP